MREMSIEEITLKRLGAGEYGDVFEGFYASSPNVKRAYKFMKSGDTNLQPILRELFVSDIVGLRTGAFMYTSKTESCDKPTFVLESELGTCDMTSVFNHFAYSSSVDFKIMTFFGVLHNVQRMHELGVLHLDIKPQNIVLQYDKIEGALDMIPNFKLVDFSLSVRTSSPRDFNVVTIWWRAPEIMLRLPYTEKVDAWSVGIIFAHMCNSIIVGSKSFSPLCEYDYFSQLWDCVGYPSVEEWPDMFSDMATFNILGLAPLEAGLQKPFKLDSEHEKFRPLLVGLLQQNPEKRWSIAQAVDFLQQFEVLYDDPFFTACHNLFRSANRSLSRIKDISSIPSTDLVSILDVFEYYSWPQWEMNAPLSRVTRNHLASIQAASALANLSLYMDIDVRFNVESMALMMMDKTLSYFKNIEVFDLSTLAAACTFISASTNSDCCLHPTDIVERLPKETRVQRLDVFRSTVVKVARATHCRYIPSKIHERTVTSVAFIKLLLKPIEESSATSFLHAVSQSIETPPVHSEEAMCGGGLRNRKRIRTE